MILILLENDRRVIETSEFPLAIGITDVGTVMYGAEAETAPVLWVRFHQERIYIQPESSSYVTYHNEISIEGSTWLSAGDRITFGDVSIEIAGSEGMLSFSSGGNPPDEPPKEPPPESMEASTSPPPPEPSCLPAARPPRRRWAGGRGRKPVLVGFSILILAAGFVLGASPVRITVSPPPDTISFGGTFPPIPVGERYLALPGSYTVSARLTGYSDLDQNVSFGFAAKPDLKFELKKLPGRLSVTTTPIVGAMVSIDGKSAGKTPLRDIEIEPGLRTIGLTAERYLPADRTLEIRGKGEAQSINFKLLPGWGTLVVSSEPEQADVFLGSENIGRTPLTVEPMQGSYKLTLSRKGWKPVTVPIKIEASRTTRLPPFLMARIDGTLDLKTNPSGATVAIDGQFRGRTPLTLPLVSGKSYKLDLTKQGYVSANQSVRIEGGKITSVDVPMSSEYGIVFIRAQPAGATLKIDGKVSGSASRRLRLTTRPHRIEVIKDGYASYSATVTPRKGISKRLNVRLKRHIDVAREKARQDIQTKSNHIVRLIPIEQPLEFRVGASRREAGRRSNETQYSVELSRSFMIGTREVTNAQFRQFRPRHNSGTERGTDLNDPRFPVVSVTWDDAAEYLNWLSKNEGLPTAYIEQDGKMVAIEPMTGGYRLPTEAEWVFAARYEAGARPLTQPLKYPWGREMPPTRGSGNYADGGAINVLPLVIKGYSDGHTYAAPVGSFTTNRNGIHDLGGNVSEWCHDYYDAFVGSQNKVRRDPAGPRRGEFHVVRGSSWRHGSITELRLSYRDYTKSPRNDLGFRIARYVNIPK